tara:strand:+ start:987 stop:1532 length:546 start_codon:yes stop_codon:yes gene_type:complete
MELIKNLKEITLLKNLFLAIFLSMLLAISAKINIPFYPVPMTMQTFVVLLIGVLFGWKLGLFTVGLYLLEGILGLPVFAGTPEKGLGIIYFVGPTMGYLVGFLVTVFLAGFFNFNKNYILNFLKLVIAVSFIYIFGMMWLLKFTGWEKLFLVGAQPFLLAELFKVLILTIVLPKILKFRNF